MKGRGRRKAARTTVELVVGGEAFNEDSCDDEVADGLAEIDALLRGIHPRHKSRTAEHHPGRGREHHLGEIQ